MPTEPLLAIQAELAQIRAELLVISIVGGIFLVLGIIRQSFGIYHDFQKMTTEQFKTAAEDLFEQNKLFDLKAHIQERLKTRPNYDYAHWYLARALYLEGDDEGALRELAILKNISPSWKTDHIDPFVRTIHERNSAAKSPDC